MVQSAQYERVTKMKDSKEIIQTIKKLANDIGYDSCDMNNPIKTVLVFHKPSRNWLELVISIRYRVTYAKSKTMGVSKVRPFNSRFNPPENRKYTDCHEMLEDIEYWLRNDGELQ
jgi:hypothetical protein